MIPNNQNKTTRENGPATSQLRRWATKILPIVSPYHLMESCMASMTKLNESGDLWALGASACYPWLCPCVFAVVARRALRAAGTPTPAGRSHPTPMPCPQPFPFAHPRPRSHNARALLGRESRGGGVAVLHHDGGRAITGPP